MTLNPLGKVKELVEAVGLEVAYAYEDLVFLEHNAFLLQFADPLPAGEGQPMIVHTNIEADEKEIVTVISALEETAPQYGLSVTKGSAYKLTQADEETISIEFYE